MTKNGLAAVRELIAARFKDLHGDSRDKEQVLASHQLAEELSQTAAQPVVVPAAPAEKSAHMEHEFNIRSKYLYRAALHNSHVGSHKMLPRGVHQCFEVTAPSESAEELFAAALKGMEGKR